MCQIYYENKEIKAYIKRTVRGAWKDQVKTVVVGDKVQFEHRPDGDALVHEILPRKTWLTRKTLKRFGKQQVMVTNVDKLLIVTSIHAPLFHPGIIDRFLIAAHKGNLKTGIILNKVDLRDKEKKWDEITKQLAIYKELGYDVFFTSINMPDTLDRFKNELKDQVTILAGHSGVGKSSLLTTIDPDLKLAVSALNPKTKRGQHTTTNVKLMPVKCGGYVVDTPGIREFALWDLDAKELPHYFPEIQSRLHLCKFNTCTHTHEPSCAIKDAVENGEIAQFRYKSYCNILESIQDDGKEKSYFSRQIDIIDDL